MEEQTWNYSGEFFKRAKIIISDKQILLENRELSFMRFPWPYLSCLGDWHTDKFCQKIVISD